MGFFLLRNFALLIFCSLTFGEMAEWSNAAVLKTVVPKGTGGSNPSLSAKKKPQRTQRAQRKALRARGK